VVSNKGELTMDDAEMARIKRHTTYAQIAALMLAGAAVWVIAERLIVAARTFCV
jgi:hypothetical protein